MNILFMLYQSYIIGIIYTVRKYKGGIIIKRYGLILSGGGTRGAYQVGAYKALIEADINIVSVVGTSIGALNGAFIASKQFSSLYNLWVNMKFSSCFLYDDKKELSKEKFLVYIFEIFKGAFKDGGWNPDPLRKLIDKNLNERKLRESTIDYGLVTFCLSTLEPQEVFIKDIPEEHLVEYIMASCSLPGIRREHINGKAYLDGGLYSNRPIEMLVNQENIDELIVIDIEGPGLKHHFSNPYNIPITMIKPSFSLGGILKFDSSLVKKNINLGYKDTMKFLSLKKSNKLFI